MQSKLILLLAFLMLFGCDSGSDNNANNVRRNTINTSIVDTWEYIYPASQCVETNTFNDDNTFIVNSLDEVQTGTYTFDPPTVEGGRFRLVLNYLSDNGLSSCSGDISDSTGLQLTFWAEFPNSNQVNWFQTSSGGSSVGTFTRAQ